MSGLGTVCVRLAFFWAGNPFKNQAKRKVWKSQFLRKPQNLAGNPFKNQAKWKVWKSQNLRKPLNLAGNLFKIQPKWKVWKSQYAQLYIRR